MSAYEMRMAIESAGEAGGTCGWSPRQVVQAISLTTGPCPWRDDGNGGGVGTAIFCLLPMVTKCFSSISFCLHYNLMRIGALVVPSMHREKYNSERESDWPKATQPG